jgi:hypothetical protein
MRLSSSNPWMRLAAILVVIGVVAVAWYLISPLFINVQVDEGFPTLVPMPSKTPKIEPTEVPGLSMTQTAESLGFDPAQATAEMEAAMTSEPSISEEDMPEDADQGMTILAQGFFYGIAHEGTGTATIYELADGTRLLRFENFEVLNGPQLHVYLAPQNPVPDSVGVELEGIIDLGPLKGNIGDQNYTIPAEIFLDHFNSVVIWCVPFRVPFNAAPLNPQ